MWSVNLHKDVKKNLRSLPKQVVNALTVWINIAQTEGPVGLRSARGLNDEALQGKWKGFRSSRLNRQYRVIYKANKDIVSIFIVDVTPHDYRRN
ncbi:MAG: type II toxin-antitoxin system RelE/ParE family toxin [Pseudomonadales bacterium]